MSSRPATNTLATETQDSLPQIYSVREITRDIQAILEAAFDTIWIEGEISNYRIAASGHAYFTLKDEEAQIRCVLFRHQKNRLKFDPAEGDQVLLFGRVTVYGLRGEYQVVVETMEPRGMGALQKAFEQLKEKLAQEGLFDESLKKSLPLFPWKIGIVTSPTGAAIRDLIHVITRRNPKISIILYPVRVQGDGATEEVSQAIKDMNRRKDLDLLIVGRGGGSIEDLWAFNEECVARAIHESRIPVISAVGHEIDFTISDFVADVRAPTPSAAAEISVPILADLTDRLRELTWDLVVILNETVQGHKDQLLQLIDRRFFRDPLQIIQPPAQRLDEWAQRLIRAPTNGFALKKECLARTWHSLLRASLAANLPHFKRRVVDLSHRLSHAPGQGLKVKRERMRGVVHSLLQNSPAKTFPHWQERHSALEEKLIRQMSFAVRGRKDRLRGLMNNLQALSPLNTLERGYSLTIHEGRTVKTHQQVKSGDRVRVRLHEGNLDCTVDETLE